MEGGRDPLSFSMMMSRHQVYGHLRRVHQPGLCRAEGPRVRAQGCSVVSLRQPSVVDFGDEIEAAKQIKLGGKI